MALNWTKNDNIRNNNNNINFKSVENTIINIKIMAGLDGSIEPIYFLITSIAFIFLSVVQYKKSGKTKERIYLAMLSSFFIFS